MSVGVVKPHWRFTMHETMHYHSTAHEILVVSQGRALICRSPCLLELGACWLCLSLRRPLLLVGKGRAGGV